MRGPGEHQAACGDTANTGGRCLSSAGGPQPSAVGGPGPGCPLSPAHAARRRHVGRRARSLPPSLQQGAVRSAGHRPAWRPPAPLRAPAEACPSAPSAPSHWPPRPAGPAPIYNGVYQHFLKGAAVRLNHTAASGWRGERRPIGQRANPSGLVHRPLARPSVNHSHRPAEPCRVVGWLSCPSALRPPPHGSGPTGIRVRATAAL